MKNIEPENKFTLELATQPGIPNASGIVYTKEAYEKAINVYNERINMGIAYAKIGGPYGRFVNFTPSDDEQFRILSLDGTTATLSPIRMDKYDLLIESMNHSKYVLAMNYVAGVYRGYYEKPLIINKMTIISFSIVPEESVRRNRQ